MGTLLSFPMNVLNLANDFAADAHDGHVGHDGGATASEHLLSALAFLNENFEGGIDGLDAQTIQRCKNAAETALIAALSAQSELNRQSLRIAEMERIACTDELTGVYNRRGFSLEFKRVLASANRYGETGVLIYVDLDGFKPINDTYGHAAGDHVLCEVAHALLNNIRPTDLVARLGGDEFAVLLTRTDWGNGLHRAEILKHVLNTKYVSWNDKHIAVRASLGFQRYGPDDCHQSLLIKADDAMYKAKRLRSGPASLDTPNVEFQ